MGQEVSGGHPGRERFHAQRWDADERCAEVRVRCHDAARRKWVCLPSKRRVGSASGGKVLVFGGSLLYGQVSPSLGVTMEDWEALDSWWAEVANSALESWADLQKEDHATLPLGEAAVMPIEGRAGVVFKRPQREVIPGR